MSIIKNKIEIKIGDDYEKFKNYTYSDIQLYQEINKPNEFRFCMSKRILAEGKNTISLEWTEDIIGQPISLTLKMDDIEGGEKKNENDLEFSGIICNVNVRRENIVSNIVVEVVAFSPDYMLIDSEHCFSYENKPLQDVVSNILKPFDFTKVIKPTMTEEIPYTVQYNESNYAFLNRLAHRYGEWFYYDGTELVFGEMKEAENIDLYLGKDLHNYHYTFNLDHFNLSHGHHNYLTYENTSAKGTDSTEEEMHNLTDIAYKSSKEHFKSETFRHLKGATPEPGFDETELSAKIHGIGKKERLMICQANSRRPTLKIGSKVVLNECYQESDDADVKEAKHGELLIYKIVHSLTASGNYENRFWAIPGNSTIPPYSYGDFYPFSNAQRAVVIDNKDPEKLGRIRVQFLWQKEQDEEMITPWIRIAQPHGGENKGFYFIPEIEEEVMVGFENGNAEKPYVIGTLFTGKHFPEVNWYDDENNIKGIRTRNGHTVEIHDEGEGGYIKIYDNEKDNYIITLHTDEKLIKLQSTGNIELYAENDVVIDAKNNVKIKAKMDMNLVAGENYSESAGKNLTIGAGDDLSMSSGKNMDRSVGKNDKTFVQNNQIIEIKENKMETIAEKYQLTANYIREEGTDKVELYGKEIEQKSGSSLKFDGGSTLDLYASNIKIN